MSARAMTCSGRGARALTLLLVLVAAPAAPAQDAGDVPDAPAQDGAGGLAAPAQDTGDALTARARAAAFVEVESGVAIAVVGQTIPVRVTLGVESAFLREHVVSTSARPLDLPVRITGAWIDATAGVDAAPGRARPDAAAFALNDDVAHAPRGERVLGGRSFTTLVLEPRVVARTEGPLVLAPVTLELTYASAFRDDLLGGRAPLDHHALAVASEPVTIDVAPLPRAGRPDEFTGAVGTFTLRADATTRTLGAGESLALTLTVAGDGDLDAFGAPPLDALAGFHVYGHVGARTAAARTFTYDVAPLHEGVTRVPPLAFAFYDPVAGAYRTVWSEPIPLEVEPRAASDDGATKPARDASLDGTAAPRAPAVTTPPVPAGTGDAAAGAAPDSTAGAAPVAAESPALLLLPGTDDDVAATGTMPIAVLATAAAALAGLLIGAWSARRSVSGRAGRSARE